MKHFHLYGAVERPILINNAKFNAQASGTIDSPPISRCTPLVRWALFVVGLLLSLLALCVVVSPSSTTVRTDQSASYNVETKGLKAGNGYNSKLKGRQTGPALFNEKVQSVIPLTLKATNEYGEYDRAALALYGLQMIVEPYRETTITARGSGSTGIFHWKIIEADAAGQPLTDTPPVLDTQGSHEVVVTLTAPGGVFLLTVQEHRLDGSLIAEGKVKISCKRVRREIRDLKDTEREEYMDALETVYRVSTKEGQAKYGEDFIGYEHITAYHNSRHYCYHSGLQFLPAHIAFDRVMEKSIQLVNPKVSMPLWDFMIDAAVYGYNWEKSPLFSDSMFGRTAGSPDNGYQLQTGRFANITAVFDPDNSLVGPEIDPIHNPFGYLGASYDYKDSYYLTRTTSVCGMTPRGKLPTVKAFLHCFSDSGAIKGWNTCMESTIHASLHNHFSGAFNCNVDLKAFAEAHPEYGHTLLTFVFLRTTTVYWPYNTYMADYNECDTKCTRGQTEPCGCTCTIDIWSLSDDEVYDMSLAFLEAALSMVEGDLYTYYDETSDYPYGFQQDGVRLTHEQTVGLLRPMLSILCEPASGGTLITNSSPMDPVFWLFHPFFEKGQHVLWMSPKYRDNYDFKWDNGTCLGSKFDDKLPFSEKVLGMGEGTDYLTNRELMTIFNPSNPRFPYVYEKFSHWGTLSNWDFCAECVTAAASSRS